MLQIQFHLCGYFFQLHRDLCIIFRSYPFMPMQKCTKFIVLISESLVILQLLQQEIVSHTEYFIIFNGL